jgi:hypothetical protein
MRMLITLLVALAVLRSAVAGFQDLVKAGFDLHNSLTRSRSSKKSLDSTQTQAKSVDEYGFDLLQWRSVCIIVQPASC